jgi:hypothetical protein
VRTPEFPVVPSAARGVLAAAGEALGECGSCATVVSYDPEGMPPASVVLCRDCGLATLGFGGL